MIRTSRFRTALLVVTSMMSAGACQRAEPPTAGGAATTAPDAPPPALPAGALHVYVWNCRDGRTRTMRHLPAERAIVLSDGGGRLEQADSASGARYVNADASLVFWTKGPTARLENRGASPVECTESRAASLREDARVRGVVYRALGNEPGWILEIGPGTRLDWLTNYGEDHYEFEGVIEDATGNPATRTFTAANASQSIKVTVRAESCTDDAGLVRDHSATIDFEGGTLRGCAVRLN